MGRARPGQVRFEAWVPEDLFRRFQATGVSRAGWLRQQLAEFVERAEAPPPHRHKRTQTGTKWVMGSQVPVYVCAECGEDL